MGEQSSRLSRFLAKHPTCAYCSGSAPAGSIDHCPPISVFDGRHRPRGLEFPACSECHEGTRAIDQIVAVFSRVLAPADAEPNRQEIRRHIRGLFNNHPDIALLLGGTSRRQVMLEGREVYEVSIDDPERIARIQEAFGARLGLALYHEQFGVPAPATARIGVGWYPNAKLFGGDYPEELVRAMGSPRTLSAGKFSVDAQFRYWWASAGDMFGTFAVFRESFAVMSVVRDDARDDDEDESFWTPGFLKGFRC